MYYQLEAKEVLKYLIELLSEYLTEIAEIGDKENKFLCGEQIAYVECLEIIQRWENAQKNGLDYSVEKRFPLF